MILGEFNTINSSNTTLIDLHLNLQHFDIKYPLHFIESRNRGWFKYATRMLPDLNIYTLPIRCNCIRTDVVITTIDFLRNVFLRQIKISIKCKRLIILDAIDAIDLCENHFSSFYQRFLPSISNDIHYLGNPSTLPFAPINNKYEYYHKLSVDRLEQMRIEDSSLLAFVTSYNPILFDYLDSKRIQYEHRKRCRKKQFNQLKYNSLYFVRNKCTMYGSTFHNIGRIIFEYCYLQKSVSYFNNKQFNDGLTEYLKLFNIDDNVHQEITINSTDLYNKLFFHDNDLILNLIV